MRSHSGSVSSFDSLGASQAKDDFSQNISERFLIRICNILSYTGKTLTFRSVLAAAQQPDIVRETIMSVRDSVMNNPNLKQHIKDAFEMDASLLEGIYSENDWLTKIRGSAQQHETICG